jgi:hypothetical protein
VIRADPPAARLGVRCARLAFTSPSIDKLSHHRMVVGPPDSRPAMGASKCRRRGVT